MDDEPGEAERAADTAADDYLGLALGILRDLARHDPAEVPRFFRLTFQPPPDAPSCGVLEAERDQGRNAIASTVPEPDARQGGISHLDVVVILDETGKSPVPLLTRLYLRVAPGVPPTSPPPFCDRWALEGLLAAGEYLVRLGHRPPPLAFAHVLAPTVNLTGWPETIEDDSLGAAAAVAVVGSAIVWTGLPRNVSITGAIDPSGSIRRVAHATEKARRVIQEMLVGGADPSDRVERFFYPTANGAEVQEALRLFAPADQQKVAGRLVAVTTLDELFDRLGAPWTPSGRGTAVVWGATLATAIRRRLGSRTALASMWGAAVVIAWERVLLPYVRDLPAVLEVTVLALSSSVVFAPVPWGLRRLGRRGARPVIDGLLVPGAVAAVAFVILRLVVQWALRLDAWHGPLCSLPHDVNDVWNDGPWLALFFWLLGGLPMARIGAMADRLERGLDTIHLLEVTAHRSVWRVIREAPLTHPLASVVVGFGGGALMVAQTLSILDRCDDRGGAWSPFLRMHLVARIVLWPLFSVLLVAWLARGIAALRNDVEHVPETLRRPRDALDE